MADSDPYRISPERTLLQEAFITGALQATYWAAGRPADTIRRSLERSLCFGAYMAATGEQVGFARVVTDGATFGWICDVVVAEGHRRRGLGKRLMEAVMAHPDLTGIALCLATRDAHGLYERYGFRRWELMRRPRPGEPVTAPSSARMPSGAEPPAAG